MQYYQDRVIHRHHTREPFTPAAETGRNTLGRHGAPVSGQTVRRRLRERGLYCRRPATQPVLTARHRQQRLQWARQRQHWTWRQWRDVLFIDENRYCISPVHLEAFMLVSCKPDVFEKMSYNEVIEALWQRKANCSQTF